MAETGTHTGDQLKVFVSYSRADIAFADQLVLALEDKGFDPLLDRHDIDAAENWKARLGGLILSCDTVVFVLTETSAASPICRWEVEEAARLGKRMIPVVMREVEGVTPPPQLTELNYIHFFTVPAIPGSGFYDGVKKLDRALRVDLSWLRQQTRLSEQAAQWTAKRADDLLLRGVALDEALAWRTRTPKDADPPALVREFLTASEASGEQRKAEAAAQITEREGALKEKEEAVAQRARADKLTRRATLIGLGVALLLTVFSGWLGRTAARAIHAAGENRAAIFASEADARIAKDRNAEAMLIALAGNPAVRGSWTERFFLARDGYAASRTAVSAAYTRNTLERIFAGHEKGVSAVAFSPDGRRVFTGSFDKTARLWDAETGRTLHTFEGHKGGVSSVAFSPDGRRVLTGAGDRTARLWDAETGRALRTFEGHEGAVLSVAFSPDGRRVLTGANANIARLWDAETGRTLRTFEGHEGAVYSVAFSPDGKRVLTGSLDGTARLWDAETGRALRRFEGNQGPIHSVAFSPDGGRVLTGSTNWTAQLWDIDPIVLATADAQARMACAKLRSIGMTRFSAADRQRFPILQGEPASPCPGG